MGNRAAFQTAQAELPAQILLWGEFQCNQDTDMGNTHSQPSANGYAETLDTEMEFLGIGYNDKDRNDVLC